MCRAPRALDTSRRSRSPAAMMHSCFELKMVLNNSHRALGPLRSTFLIFLLRFKIQSIIRWLCFVKCYPSSPRFFPSFSSSAFSMLHTTLSRSSSSAAFGATLTPQTILLKFLLQGCIHAANGSNRFLLSCVDKVTSVPVLRQRVRNVAYPRPILTRSGPAHPAPDVRQHRHEGTP